MSKLPLRLPKASAALLAALLVAVAAPAAMAQPAAPGGQGGQAGQQRPSGPTPLPLLAANAVLQQDLGLSADQRRRLADVDQQFRQMMRGGTPGQRNSAAETYASDNLDSILTVAQGQRLQQVMLQLAGLCRTAQSPRLGQSLALTADQSTKIQGICGSVGRQQGRQGGPASGGAPAGGTEPQRLTPPQNGDQRQGRQGGGKRQGCVDFAEVARTDQQVLALLTEPQRVALTGIIGKRLDLSKITSPTCNR